MDERREKGHAGGWRRGVLVLMAGGLPLLMAAHSAGGEQGRRQERQEMRQRIDAACQDSLASLCAEERGPERFRCLMEHHADASPECQALLDEIRQHHEQERERRSRALAEACGESAKALCHGQEGPELVHCLMERSADASAECQALLDEIRAGGRPGHGRRG